MEIAAMTRAEIFVELLSEVTGKPKEEVADVLPQARNILPAGKWDEEIPPDESERLLNYLRPKGPAILELLTQKGIDFARRGDDA
jgi:hypothetical protein